MEKIDEKVHYQSMMRFVEFANELKSSGVSEYTVSAALMTASCVCATQVALGHKGSLNDTGVNAISEVYKQQLQVVQKKRQGAHARESEKQLKESVEDLVSFPEDE
jgi:hypothetical protein